MNLEALFNPATLALMIPVLAIVGGIGTLRNPVVAAEA